MADYPTKEEILKNLKVYQSNRLQLRGLKIWKVEIWYKARNKGEKVKFTALKKLIKDLNVLIGKPRGEVKVEYDREAPSCYYVPSSKTIFINKSLSILSCLHELGHHLYGSSELTACTYSIALFKKAFPIAYSELEWDGHLLKRKAQPSCATQ